MTMRNLQSSEETKKVQAIFEAEMSDVCYRCRLRYAGIKEVRCYFEKPEVRPDQNAPGEPDEKKLKLESVPCRACLGILQDEFMQTAIDKVSESIKDCGYDADHFTIAISLPVSLALRHHSIVTFLEDKMNTFDEDDVVPLKQSWKWIFSKEIETRVEKKSVTGDFCQFYVELEMSFGGDAEELICLQKMCEEEYKMRQQKKQMYHMGLVTRQGAEKSLKSVSDKKFRLHYSVPPQPLDNSFTVKNVTMFHNSIYFAGRYNKYSRELPQTPWVVDGVKKMETSVEEIISDQIKPVFHFDAAKFSSSGREDVDVRMLGSGRPFLLEITNPRKTKFTQKELDAIKDKINSSSQDVQIRDFQIVSKNEIKLLKEGEDQKTKTYTAVCKSNVTIGDISKIQAKLDQTGNVVLKQKTPIRVLHRRPNAVRERTVGSMKVEKINDFLFKLSLVTQAGTYVKEFVHGDFDRTSPNLRSILGFECDIMALDVEAIDLDWPRSISSC